MFPAEPILLKLHGPDPTMVFLKWALLAAGLVVILIILAVLIYRAGLITPLATLKQSDKGRLPHEALALLRVIRDNATLILNEHPGRGKVIPFQLEDEKGNLIMDRKLTKTVKVLIPVMLPVIAILILIAAAVEGNPRSGYFGLVNVASAFPLSYHCRAVLGQG